MPPQDPKTSQVPGEDVLLDTLRRSSISDDQRQQLWDAYHTQGKEDDFVGALNKLSIPGPSGKSFALPDEMKQTLYDMRYKGFKNMPSNTQASTIASLNTQTPAKGDVRPSTPDVLNKTTGISARSTTWTDRIGAVVAPFMQHVRQGGAAQDPNLVDISGAMTPTEKSQHPMLNATGEFASSLTSGGNLALIAGTAGIGGAAPALSKVMGFAFSAQMLKGAYDRYAPLKEAWDKGDEEGVKYHLTHMLLSGALGLHGVTDGMSTDPSERFKVRKQLDAEAKLKGNDPVLNAAVRQAVRLPDTSTPLGPISEKGGQQLHLDFITKAPVEAQAPQDTGGASKVANAPTREVMAQTPSTSRGTSVGAESSLPPELHADLEKQAGRKLTPSDAVALDRSNMERGMASGIGKADESSAIREQKRSELEKPDPTRYAKKVEPAPSTDVVSLVKNNFTKVADLNRQIDLAENDSHADNLIKQKDQLENQTIEALKQQPLGPQHVQAFKETAERFDAQAKAVRDLTEATIKNRGVKNELADLRSQGGPPRTAVVDPETGERALVKPEDKVGRGARSVLDELQGRVPTSEFNAMQIAGKPEGVSDQEWTEHVGKLQEERQNLKRKISDSVTIASETGASVADMGIEEHVDRLKQIEGLLGKYVEPAEPGRRPQKPVELGDKGEIKATEPLKSWTWARVKAAFGGKYKQIPSDEEFFQEADHLQERGRLFRRAADVAQQVSQLRTQRGGIGEVALRGEVRPVSLADRVPPDNELMRRAAEAKLYTVKIDDTFTGGHVGLLSKDGRTWIETAPLTHDAAADRLIPEVRKDGSALRAMLEKGWIRKAGPREYESWDLDNKAKSAIEMDLYRTGRHGQEVFLDTRMPTGRMVPGGLTLESGWEDFDKALTKAQRKAGLTGELGALTTGTQSLIGSTVLGITGGVVGAHFGHPEIGGAIGWGLGFMTPEIAGNGRLWARINSIRPSLNAAGITMKDWLMGPKQLPLNDPDMENILDAQRRDLQGPTRSLMTRVAQLPADTWVKLRDPLLFVNDRPGAMINFLTRWDNRVRPFFDLRGKLDVDNSPMVTARLAAGQAAGEGKLQLMDYTGIARDAFKGQLYDHLNKYLNLKGYQRAYDVLKERLQESLDAQDKATQALKQPNLPVEIEAGIRKALREAKAEEHAVTDRVAQGNVVPGPYDPQKIQSDLQGMRQDLGPKFDTVKALADRVFALNRKILDKVWDAGIISDADYQKYTSRGDEYIPMHRILEQTLEHSERTYGAGSPYYLRQQNVIKALTGSDKVNRDPLVASASANLEALREVYRNGVITDYLKIAAVDPAVGSLFREVKSGGKAGPNEGLVGAYRDGQQFTYAVPVHIAEALKGASPVALDATTKVMKIFSNVLRKGATVENLTWSLPNAVRHIEDMATMSEAGLTSMKTLPKDVAGLVKDWNKSLYSVITKDPAWQEYMRSGAAASVMQRAITPEEYLDVKTLGSPFRAIPTRLLNKVEDFNKMVEDTTKLTTFRRLREAGYSEKAAAWETKRYGGGPDFAQMGTASPAVNLALMFFNAKINYVSRAFSRVAENPVRMATTLGALSAMAMTLNQWNYSQKDDKGNSLMRQVSRADRENNFVFLTGDVYKDTGQPIKALIPKGSLIKFFANPIENMLNKIAGNEDRTGTELGLQAVSNLSPSQMNLRQGEIGKSAIRGAVSSLNPVLKTPMEEMMNYSTRGEGGPIVPGSQQRIESQYQFGPGTSKVARQMGEGGWRGAAAGAAEGATIGSLLYGSKGGAIGGALGGITGSFGISPRRADHIIDSTTAGVGRIATGFVDPFLGGVNQTKLGQDKITNLPLVGPISRSVLGSSIDQREQLLTEEFYRNAQQAQVPLATLEYLKKNNMDEAIKYMDKHQNDLWQGQLVIQAQKRLGQLDSMLKTTIEDQSMTDSQKGTALKNIHSIKIQLLTTVKDMLRPSPQVGQAAAAPGQGQGAPR